MDLCSLLTLDTRALPAGRLVQPSVQRTTRAHQVGQFAGCQLQDAEVAAHAAGINPTHQEDGCQLRCVIVPVVAGRMKAVVWQDEFAMHDATSAWLTWPSE